MKPLLYKTLTRIQIKTISKDGNDIGGIDIAMPDEQGNVVLNGFEIVEKMYLFSWEDIQGNDRNTLTNFLKSKYDLEWVKEAKIAKTNNGKTIILTAGENNLSMNLNDENTEMNLEIDFAKTDKFIVKSEKKRAKHIRKNTRNWKWNKRFSFDILLPKNCQNFRHGYREK